MSTKSRPVYFNPNAQPRVVNTNSSADSVARFHQQLPGFQATPLLSLDDCAKELGVRAIYVKDESTRLGLPSFKILGASWGVFRAVARTLDLPLSTDLDTFRQALASRPVRLHAATDGNHGRAVARMGSILSIPTEIRVPASMHPKTIELIRLEGAEVSISSGDYDTAVLESQVTAEKSGGIFVQDFAFDAYTEIPQWIVDGYATMMREIDEQVKEDHINLVVAPVGVGSFAQAVVSHFKGKATPTGVMTVEPDTAACLYKSLRQGEPVTERTSPTIMAGLDCGTVSSIAWPLLREGVDASLSISDHEAYTASVYLRGFGISAGPCGAAPLAALRRLSESDKTALGLTSDSSILLLCTEGSRDYEEPLSVDADDPIALTQILVQIDSVNPTLGSTPGAGETAIARYIKAWLEHRDIESHWIELVKGRPSVVGVVRGHGNGKSLMFNGHIDTVSVSGYEGDPLSGHIKDGKLYGRGSADMKGGVAAALVALARSKDLGLQGDVIFAGVADEEAESIGTEQVLQAGWRADAAIVNEPTNLEIIHSHKGFVWLEVDIFGLAAHSSRADLGIDAITRAGYFLVELDKYAQRLRQGMVGSAIEAPSVHASLTKGGEEISSYPALCTISIERRTVGGETPEIVVHEIQAILEKLEGDILDFKFDLRCTFNRPSFSISTDHPFVSLVGEVVGDTLRETPVFNGQSYWTDCALLSAQGIPALLWGPRGEGLHAKEEYVEVDSVRCVADALIEVARRFCI
ncbi:tryptophan synthase beta subunit-like PLP-dependent enzyme [Biscogniauxia marginata]|nr:tryptophan synthase beta subunit-like PLP-dependent enzyme [Biscogniauxia marginata]